MTRLVVRLLGGFQVELGTRGAGGYTGGYAGWEPNQQKEMWKATEHNLDLYAAFARLHALTGQARGSCARSTRATSSRRCGNLARPGITGPAPSTMA